MGPDNQKTETQKALAEMENVSNQGWDDLHKLYREANAIFLTAHQVVPFLKDKDIQTYVRKAGRTDELEGLAKQLKENIDKAKADLDLIYAKHKDKSGDNTHPDELMECINIGQEYSSWMLAYQEVILPIVKNILEIVNISDKEDVLDD